MRHNKMLTLTMITLSLFLVEGCGAKETAVEPTISATVETVAPTSEAAKEEETTKETEAVKETEPEEQATEGNPYHRIDSGWVQDYDAYNAWSRHAVSEQEAEGFASQVTECFAKEDWETLAGLVSYPIIINDVLYKDEIAFLGEDWSNIFSEEFIQEMAEADTTDLMANWVGFRVGKVIFYFEGNDYALRISQIDFSDGLEHKGDSSLFGYYDLDFDLTNANLLDYKNLEEMFGDKLDGGTLLYLMDGNSDYTRYWYFLGGEKNSFGDAFIDESSITLNESTGDNVVGYEQRDGVMYIEMNYNGETLYWKKLAMSL